MPQNKKQHYVPRFYLKRFSSDEASINIWLVQHEKDIYGASLEDQCYKNYFYGKQLDVEQALGVLENNAYAFMETVETRRVLPIPWSPGHCFMILYVLMQYVRTEFYVDTIDDMHDRVLRHMYRQKMKSLGIDIDQYKIGIQDVAAYALGVSSQTYPVLLDLNYKLLVNRTDTEFVTSDNPVVLYNQLLSFRNRKIGSQSGIAQKGLQIFFPIGPNLAIIFFDDNVYAVGKQNSQIVDVTLYKDVHEINTLQVCSASNCIYFRGDGLNVKALYRKASKFRRRKSGTFTVLPLKETKKAKKELIAFSHEEIRTNLKLSFIRLTKKTKKWKKDFLKLKRYPVAIIRNQTLYDDYQEFSEKVKNKEFNELEFLQFLETKVRRVLN